MPACLSQASAGGLLVKAQAALSKTGVASILFCGGPLCRHFTVQARWLRRDGIHLHSNGNDSAWLCSPGCVAAALSARLRVSALSPRAAGIPPRMPFRLALLRAGVISDVALQVALKRCQQMAMPLGTLLLSEGAITDEQLAAALAAESGCAHYTLPPTLVAAEFALPRLLAERFRAAMLHARSGRCVLGFVDRIDRRLMAMVATITGLRVEAAFVTEANRAAHASVKLPGLWIAPTDTVVPPVAAVKLLTDYASQCGAEHIALAVQPGLLWARFSRHSADFLDQVMLLEEQHDLSR